MNMRTQAEQYLAMRRSLGYQLRAEGRMLLDFVDRLDKNGQRTITIVTAVAWACEPITSTMQHQCRLRVVRGFARHLSAFDPACEVPPTNLLVARAHRPTPYLFSPEEIAALIHAAGTITAPLPAATMQALIALIAASGIRLGEALALDRGDVDAVAGMLRVTGKNSHTRMLPVHPTTVAMLDAYAARRDQLCPDTTCPGFFVTTTGRRVQQSGVQQTFAKLLVLADIHTPAGMRRPRIHQLRHTFAVTSLVGWYQQGVDVTTRLPVLSTYLGHASTEATYWYLQASPELLALAAERLERADRDATAHSPAICARRTS